MSVGVSLRYYQSLFLMPMTSLPSFPQPLPELYKVEMDCVTLLDSCCGTKVSVTTEMAEPIERLVEIRVVLVYGLSIELAE